MRAGLNLVPECNGHGAPFALNQRQHPSQILIEMRRIDHHENSLVLGQFGERPLCGFDI